MHLEGSSHPPCSRPKKTHSRFVAEAELKGGTVGATDDAQRLYILPFGRIVGPPWKSRRRGRLQSQAPRQLPDLLEDASAKCS